MANAFNTDPTKYIRDFNPNENARKVYIHYIYKKVKSKGFSLEAVTEWVNREWVSGGKLGLNDIPTKIVYYDPEKGYDREFRTVTWERYLETIRREKHVVSPSGTAFYNQNRRLSPLNNYLAGKKKDRSFYKKKEQECDMAKDKLGSLINKTVQTSKKTALNSLSGTESLSNNPLYAESIHPVLTSFCRTGTSHANAINERFIAGNRHYWHPYVVKNEIASLSVFADPVRVMQVVVQYGLNIPTHDDVLNVIKRNIKPYFRDDAEMALIEELVMTMEDYERVFYCYHLDLYTLEVLNPIMVKQMIIRMSSVGNGDVALDDCSGYIKSIDEDAVAAVGVICCNQTRGVKREDWSKVEDDYKTIGSTALNFRQSLDHYDDLMSVFWSNDLLLSSIYELPGVRRKCVLGGDTDSTLYTVQLWQAGYSEKLLFSDTTRAVSTVIIYYSSVITAHVLRQMSRNAGCVDEHIDTFTMKNEFFFPSFVLTGRAKHYYASQEVKEGNFLPDPALEIKGVHMRSSKWPLQVKKDVAKIAKYVIDSGYNNTEISLASIFNEIAIYENMILKGLETGDSSFLSGFKITEGTTNEIFLDCWDDIFGDRYGRSEGRTIRSLKVPVTNDTPKKTEAWIASITDASIRANAESFVKRRRKDKFTFMAIPDTLIGSCGVPKEILGIVNKEDLFNGALSGFYLILESLNIFIEKGVYGEYVSEFYEYDLYNNRILDPSISISILGAK